MRYLIILLSITLIGCKCSKVAVPIRTVETVTSSIDTVLIDGKPIEIHYRDTVHVNQVIEQETRQDKRYKDRQLKREHLLKMEALSNWNDSLKLLHKRELKRIKNQNDSLKIDGTNQKKALRNVRKSTRKSINWNVLLICIVIIFTLLCYIFVKMKKN